MPKKATKKKTATTTPTKKATKKKTATTSPTSKPAAQKKTATTTPTKKATEKKTATTSPAAKPAARGEDAPVASAVHALLAGLAPISDVTRAAFASRAPDEVCDALGARTKSAAVARDALAFAKVIEPTLRATPTAVRPYSAARFAWLLENVAALLDARTTAATETKKASSIRDAAAGVEATARAIRDDLLAILGELAGDDAADAAALEAARGSSDSRAALATYLQALADLAARWLARTDATGKALVSASGLAQGDVDRARAAAVALVSASASTALGGRVDPRDTAAVNRVEGRVLFEMRGAMTAFANAHARDKAVPRLVPGAGTRAAFTRPKSGTAPATPVTPTPAS